MHTVGIYAALLTLLFIYLSKRTISLRHQFKIGIGDGGNQEILRAMRVQANFVEYTPLALLLLVLLALLGAPTAMLHVLGAMLVFGRVSHAYGVSQAHENFRYRIAGMLATFFTLFISAAWLLVTGVW